MSSNYSIYLEAKINDKWECINGLEELYPIDRDEYKELSDEEKKQYVYYEWDDCWGWNMNFKEIYRNALKEISNFEEANYGLADRCFYRLVLIGD